MKKLLFLLLLIPVLASAQWPKFNKAYFDTILPFHTNLYLSGPLFIKSTPPWATSDTSVHKILYWNNSTKRIEILGGATGGGSDTGKVNTTGTDYMYGKYYMQDSVFYNKASINSVLGTTGTKAVKSLTTVDISTLGFLTTTNIANVGYKNFDQTNQMSEWYNIGTITKIATSSTRFVYTSTTSDHLKYLRSLIKIKSKVVAVTCNATNNTIISSSHGQQIGNIFYFSTATTTLPTVTGSPALEKDKAYYITYVTTDTIKFSEQPSGTNIDLTNTGTNVKVSFQKHGYIQTYALNSTGLADTLTCVLSADLTTNDSLAFVTPNRKVYDYEYFSYDARPEVVADASNPVGRRELNTKQASYIFSVNCDLGTAASGAGAAFTWNMYNGATAMFTSAPAHGTSTSLAAQRPDASKQYIAQGSNLTFRITASGGATNAASYAQWQYYRIPTNMYARP